MIETFRLSYYRTWAGYLGCTGSEVVSHALAPSLGVSSWVPRRAPAMSYGIAPKDAQAEIEKGFGVHDEVEGAVAVRERNGG